MKMGAKPLSKTKVVAHLAQKVDVSKKTAATFFDELFKLALKESKGTGKFVIPGVGAVVKVSRKTRTVRTSGRNRDATASKKGNRSARSEKALSALAKVYEF
jgi:nucleoid DNA-binding protein